MEKTANPKLIHIARIQSKGGGFKYLFLRKVDPQTFTWFEQNESNHSEMPTAISSTTVEEAIRLANREWSDSFIKPLNCGFRYTLPERDEHGNNALFHQMAASYASSNGVYFDEDLGNNCFINFASREARELMQTLKQEGRL